MPPLKKLSRDSLSPRDSSLLTNRPKGLKMVSESKFCVEFENPFLSCRTAGFKAPERVNYPTPHFFPNLPKIKYIPIMSLLVHQMT